MPSVSFATALACLLFTYVFASHTIAQEDKEPPQGSQYPLLAQVLALNDKELPPDPTADHALKVLNKVVNLQYPDTPIGEVMIDLRLRFGTAMYLDEPALTAAKVSSMAKFKFRKKGTPLFAGLHDMARTQALTFHYRYHAIWLTTPKAAKDWKDPAGTLSLKPAKGSPLEKALGEPVKFDFLFMPMTTLPAALKEQHGVAADISALVAPIEKRKDRPNASQLEKSLALRDALGILLTMQDYRCREKDGVLVIEPIKPLK